MIQNILYNKKWTADIYWTPRVSHSTVLFIFCLNKFCFSVCLFCPALQKPPSIHHMRITHAERKRKRKNWVKSGREQEGEASIALKILKIREWNPKTPTPYPIFFLFSWFSIAFFSLHLLTQTSILYSFSSFLLPLPTSHFLLIFPQNPFPLSLNLCWIHYSWFLLIWVTNNSLQTLEIPSVFWPLILNSGVQDMAPRSSRGKPNKAKSEKKKKEEKGWVSHKHIDS